MSKPEEQFALQIKAAGLPKPEREYKFHPTRKWRLDFAWPDHNLAVEIEGGIWTGGRHTKGSGFEKDLEKYNSVTAWGWKLYRFSPAMVRSGEALQITKNELMLKEIT